MAMDHWRPIHLLFTGRERTLVELVGVLATASTSLGGTAIPVPDAPGPLLQAGDTRLTIASEDRLEGRDLVHHWRVVVTAPDGNATLQHRSWHPYATTFTVTVRGRPGVAAIVHDRLLDAHPDLTSAHNPGA
jgi:hypothetical protein